MHMNHSKWLRTASLFAIGLVTASCSSDGGDSTSGEPDIAEEGATPPSGFQFAMSEALTLDLVVQFDGVVVEGAVVQLVDHVDTADLANPLGVTTSETFFVGTTNASGAVMADFTLPTDRDDLDLVVDLPGATGPYSEEALRTQWGIFAPSSRTTLERADFAGLQSIQLTTP